MCNCCKSNLPDLTVEDRNHRAISDGFNQVELIQRLNELVAHLSDERERLLVRISELERDLCKEKNK